MKHLAKLFTFLALGSLSVAQGMEEEKSFYIIPQVFAKQMASQNPIELRDQGNVMVSQSPISVDSSLLQKLVWTVAYNKSNASFAFTSVNALYAEEEQKKFSNFLSDLSLGDTAELIGQSNVQSGLLYKINLGGVFANFPALEALQIYGEKMGMGKEYKDLPLPNSISWEDVRWHEVENFVFFPDGKVQAVLKPELNEESETITPQSE